MVKIPKYAKELIQQLRHSICEYTLIELTLEETYIYLQGFIQLKEDITHTAGGHLNLMYLKDLATSTKKFKAFVKFIREHQ